MLKEASVRWEERRHQSSEVAREFRQRETRAEDVLWDALRGRKVAGLKFRRQHPVGGAIPDFCCPEPLLAIEVDGSVHDTTAEHDAERTLYLEVKGYRVIRFRNEEVLTDLASVLERITAAIRINSPG